MNFYAFLSLIYTDKPTYVCILDINILAEEPSLGVVIFTAYEDIR